MVEWKPAPVESANDAMAADLDDPPPLKLAPAPKVEKKVGSLMVSDFMETARLASGYDLPILENGTIVGTM